MAEEQRIPTDDEVMASTAQAHRVLAQVLERASAQVSGEDFSDWSGPAATEAREKKRKLSELMSTHAADLTTLGAKHDALVEHTVSVRNTVLGIMAGAVVAAGVGIALTIFTFGWSTLAAEAVTAAAAALVGETIAGFLGWLAGWVAELGIMFAIGLAEGVTFTGINHRVTGTPWTKSDAKQILAIAVGNTVGRLVGLGFVNGAELAGAAASQGLSSLGGAVTGGTLGAINPYLVSGITGRPAPSWQTEVTSVLVNMALGAAGGAITYRPKPVAATGAGTELTTLRPQPVGGGQYVNAAGENVPLPVPPPRQPVGGSAAVEPETAGPSGAGTSEAGGSDDADSVYYSAGSESGSSTTSYYSASSTPQYETA